MIKTYNTQTEYENATPSSTESTLSYIKENNEAKIDGVMVVTESPKKGDICVLDTNNEIHYYSLESFDLTKLPAGWTAVGFVEWVRGGKVKVDRVLGSYPYAKYFLYELTGYIADGASHAFSVTANSATCSGNYSGTTIAQIAASMNAVVGSFDFNGHQFHIYERVVINPYSTSNHNSVAYIQSWLRVVINPYSTSNHNIVLK